MIIFCWLKEIFRTIINFIPISGHDFVDIEEHENCKVIISKCEYCGKIDISWEK